MTPRYSDCISAMTENSLASRRTPTMRSRTHASRTTREWPSEKAGSSPTSEGGGEKKRGGGGGQQVMRRASGYRRGHARLPPLAGRRERGRVAVGEGGLVAHH